MIIYQRPEILISISFCLQLLIPITFSDKLPVHDAAIPFHPACRRLTALDNEGRLHMQDCRLVWGLYSRCQAASRRPCCPLRESFDRCLLFRWDCHWSACDRHIDIESARRDEFRTLAGDSLAAMSWKSDFLCNCQWSFTTFKAQKALASTSYRHRSSMLQIAPIILRSLTIVVLLAVGMLFVRQNSIEVISVGFIS